MTTALHATTLYATTKPSITFPAALTWADISGVALLTSPNKYDVATADATGCHTSAGQADLGAVFEARVFDKHRELRWWHDGDGVGRAVVISEDLSALPTGGETVDPIAAIDVIPGGYLLWGRTTHAEPPPWTTIVTARIGSLKVPASDQLPNQNFDQQRVRLAVREYVAAEPVHGNAYVAEERLVSLDRIAAVAEERTT